jgi:hypothetical protein
MFTDLQSWYREWHAIHRQRYDEDHVLVKLLEAELVYAQLWTVCVALRGCQWDKVRMGDLAPPQDADRDSCQMTSESWLFKRRTRRCDVWKSFSARQTSELI